jgi:hypothetical protein
VISAAFLKIPARFIASVRSGPGGNARANSRAVSASASRSSFGCGFLILRAMGVLRLIVIRSGDRSGCGAALDATPRRLADSPAGGQRLAGIAGADPSFSVAALRTFELAMLETFRAGRHRSRYHPHLAVGAARTVGWQQLGIGFRHPRHGERKINPVQKACLSGG